MNVHWTEAALTGRRGLHRTPLPRDADAMVRRIIERTEQLSQHPLIGSVVPEYESAALRQLLESPYRIIYQVLPKQINIVAVVHAARQTPPSPPATP